MYISFYVCTLYYLYCCYGVSINDDDNDVMFVADCFLDLNFVVDSSGSINEGPGNWNITLQFVSNVVRQFTIGPNNVQVAFVLFSDVATVEWGLTQYSDLASLIDAIRNVRYIGSATNLNDALYVTRTRVFAPGRGTRRNAIKVTIILTDGEDNVPVEGTPLTIANATACKRDGIRLIGIGVSDDVNRARLLQIVSSPTDYHSVDDFNALRTIIDQLTPHICVTTPGPGPSIRLHSTCLYTYTRSVSRTCVTVVVKLLRQTTRTKMLHA